MRQRGIKRKPSHAKLSIRSVKPRLNDRHVISHMDQGIGVLLVAAVVP